MKFKSNDQCHSISLVTNLERWWIFYSVNIHQINLKVCDSDQRIKRIKHTHFWMCLSSSFGWFSSLAWSAILWMLKVHKGNLTSWFHWLSHLNDIFYNLNIVLFYNTNEIVSYFMPLGFLVFALESFLCNHVKHEWNWQVRHRGPDRTFRVNKSHVLRVLFHFYSWNQVCLFFHFPCSIRREAYDYNNFGL